MGSDERPAFNRQPRPTIIMTMAGRGQRFRDAGYRVPKYEIEVKGRTLFCWALSSLEQFLLQGSNVVFVALAEQGVREFLKRECSKLNVREFELVELSAVTDGQATTALRAGKVLGRTEQPILVYNIDTYVEASALAPAFFRGAGWVPCFPGLGDAWSFLRCDDRGIALELREKERISNHATIGLYGFQSFRLYAEIYGALYSHSSVAEAGERYIAPMYNAMIERGLEVHMDVLPQEVVHPLGTPAEVDAFKEI